MKLAERIATRRNIKTFRQDPVDETLVNAALQTATMAPNHRMTEPWEVVFVGPKARAALNHGADFGGAPIVLAVLSNRGQNELEREENLVATACFVQNFLLLLHAVEVGTRWASLGSLPKNREILGAAEKYDVVGVFGIGYPSEIPAPKMRTPISEKTRHLP